MLSISSHAKKSNLTPEVVKQATGINTEEEALKQQIKDLRQQAKANFEKAVRLDPDYLRAKENLRKLMALLPPSF
jgi:3-methyladenine DNA glycosylase/8-oxoguanine DNA glycosylase